MLEPIILSPLTNNRILTTGRLKRYLLAIPLILLLLSFPSTGILYAGQYSDISAPLLNHMMQTDDKIVVINVLSEIEYEMHHITGSISIQVNKLKGTDKLPEDKNTPLVFYCMGFR